MFKRIAFILSVVTALFALSVPAFAGHADSESDTQNREGVYVTDLSTWVFRVSSGGHIVNHTMQGQLGSPTSKWKKLWLADNGIETSTGFSRTHELFLDLPAKDHDVILAGAFIASGTLVSAGTTYVTADFAQPSVPRNIVVLATGPLAGNATMTITAGTCYVQGYNSVGISTNEYVSLVSTGDAAIGRGNIAWAKISSITITGVTFHRTPDAQLKIFVGTSDKIGLANKIDSTADIYHVNEAGTVTTTYTANSTFNTIDFATDGNGSNDYDVRYIQKYFTPLP